MAERINTAGFRTELAGRTKFGDVEIDLQDTLLGQNVIDPNCQRKLQEFADRTWNRPKKQVLRNLLSDRGGTTQCLTLLRVVDDFAQGAPVDAMMLAELRVFR